ncbi:MAG: 30S ribosomal protein S3ae [Euryarchaeota archaeon]|nr:30S ribosomal protein S3ae [Euryarchaeota archaeon]
MAEKKARTVQKKVKDKWKTKQWYSIKAPKIFNEVPVAVTLADEPEKMMGRIAEATMQDITGDFSKVHVKLFFKVNGVVGLDATSKFVGHELTTDYLRRLIRRKHSKIDAVYDVTTKDGYSLRVKPVAVTEKRTKTSQEAQIRREMATVMTDFGSRLTLPEFTRDMINGELNSALFKVSRKVYPVKKVEIRKSEIRKEPAEPIEHEPMFAKPEPVEAAETPEEPVTDAPAEASAPEAPTEEKKERAEEELTEEERV